MTKTTTTNRPRTPGTFREQIKEYKRHTDMSFDKMSKESPFAPIPGGTLSAIYNDYPIPRRWLKHFGIRSLYTITYRHVKIRSDDPISAAATLANALKHGKITQHFMDRFLDELDLQLPDPCEYVRIFTK